MRLFISALCLSAAVRVIADTKYGMPEKFKLQNLIDPSPAKGVDKAGSKYHAENVIAKHHFMVPTYENNATRFKVIKKRVESKKLNLFNLT
ncbi:unnamed protein product, partial [Iphiclides podalirius]